MTIKLIVGLQNPGVTYENTRHNAGSWFVTALVEHYHATFKVDTKRQALLANFADSNHDCKALLPLTFMNQSGLPTKAVSQFYRINPDEILVVHDELDLPAGRIKLKTDGGHGGHNGLKDIVFQLGSRAFHRLRIGIGHPGHKDKVLDYVLGKPCLHDKQLILDAIQQGITMMPTLLAGNVAAVMTVLNANFAS